MANSSSKEELGNTQPQNSINTVVIDTLNVFVDTK